MAGLIPTSRAYEGHDGNIIIQKLSETAYDRTIESYRSFCHFLQDVYVLQNSLQEPPKGGWNEVNEKTFAPLHKSKKVITLLQNMTNIGLGYEMYPNTLLVDYRHLMPDHDPAPIDIDNVKHRTQGYEDVVPSDVVGLGYWITRERTEYFLLEVSNGILHWYGGPFGRTDFGQRLKTQRTRAWQDGHDRDWDSSWMSESSWPVEEFFEFLKSKFRSMDILPYRKWQVATTQTSDDSAIKTKVMPRLREIYLDHGWPDNFRKEECAAEVAKLNIRELSDFELS